MNTHAARRLSVVQRRISPESGRALEILGHSIQYLEDEFTHCIQDPYERVGMLDAVEVLKQLNREIYLSCPVVPSWTERIWNRLGFKAIGRKS